MEEDIDKGDPLYDKKMTPSTSHASNSIVWDRSPLFAMMFRRRTCCKQRENSKNKVTNHLFSLINKMKKRNLNTWSFHPLPSIQHQFF